MKIYQAIDNIQTNLQFWNDFLPCGSQLTHFRPSVIPEFILFI
jgi:hypothetical protein